jgi:hypothetical protein
MGRLAHIGCVISAYGTAMLRSQHVRSAANCPCCEFSDYWDGGRQRGPVGSGVASGNPSGIARNRLKFEEAFYGALIEQGAPEEAASLLWESARKREPWAIQTILQRLAPQTQQIKLTHEVEDENAIDYTRLAAGDIEQVERILEVATTPVAATERYATQTLIASPSPMKARRFPSAHFATNSLWRTMSPVFM